MPTYVYRREDGSTFELEQRITEDALKTCPETGQKVERVITGSAGLIFKGSGFYLTDYVRGNGDGSARKASDGSESNGSSSKDADTKASDANGSKTTSAAGSGSSSDASTK